MRPAVLATRNPDKVREIAAIIPRSWRSLDDFPELEEVVEDQPDLEGNARKKALEVALAVGIPAVADDTGLFVAALDGAPGVYSARYAGPDASYADNCHKLLQSLAGVAERQAAFRCVAAYASPDGLCLLAEGRLDGVILEAPRGGDGFGYDPVFFVPGLGKTLAELDPAGKNAISHRARAFRKLDALMRQHGL